MRRLAKLIIVMITILCTGCFRKNTVNRSAEIASFECRFSTAQPDAEDNRYAVISYYAMKNEDGNITGVANRVCRDAPESYSVEFKSDLESLSDLQELISEIELTKLNGINNRTGEETSEYGCMINIVYASGETLSCYDSRQNWLTDLQMKALRKWFEATAGL